MKTALLTSALSILGSLVFTSSSAQSDLIPDQNPNYAVSRDKYMRVADSINQWHATTVQQTYTAYDWYEQKQQRRDENRRFRQALQLEWARNFYSPYYYDSYYQPYYRDRYYDRYHRHYYY